MQIWLSLPCSYRAYQKGLQVFYPSAWKKVCSLRGKATINISKAFWARQYRLTVYHLPSTAGQVGRAKKPHFPFALLLLIDRTFGDSLHSTQSTSIYGKKDSSCSCGGAGRAAIRNRLFLNTEEILGKILGILSRSIKSETSNVPIFICLLESVAHPRRPWYQHCKHCWWHCLQQVSHYSTSLSDHNKGTSHWCSSPVLLWPITAKY